MATRIARIVAASAALVVVVWTLSLMAQEGRPARPAAPAAPQAGASAGMVVPGYWALGFKSVQKEINLTEDQLHRLRSISAAYQVAMQRTWDQLRDLSPQDQQRKMPEVREAANQLFQAAQKRVAGVLSPEQVEVVRKIDFRLRAVGAVGNAQLQQKIGVTERQQRQIAEIFEEARQKAEQLQRDTADRAIEVLTAEQQQALRRELESPQPQPQQ